ncbi:hypothetical protein MCG98_05635 [Ruminococcus sp. OA3]|uniref:hypothetical protein n=1 Tax=Ruminococcus sp. OA3 TaxID=2914164 RepID=UPI001F06BFFA|nr:hypothetical protein [Ruminococcus sp. OA3]MCH1982043.1 hypothetical protein [Ruminococcus sp. OA3]
MTYQVHTIKFIIFLLTGIVLCGCAVQSFLLSYPLVGMLLAMLALFYLGISFFSAGAFVTVNEDGVRLHALGITLKKFRWDDIKEVGIAGTKVFNRKKKEKCGSVYFYFCKKEMNDEERFDMCLKWPPTACIYLHFDNRKFDYIQSKWNKKIVTYNVGNLMI